MSQILPLFDREFDDVELKHDRYFEVRHRLENGGCVCSHDFNPCVCRELTVYQVVTSNHPVVPYETHILLGDVSVFLVEHYELTSSDTD